MTSPLAPLVTPTPTTTMPAAATMGSAPGAIDPLTLVAITVVVVGVVLIVFAWPKKSDRATTDRSLVRSWIAMSLVLGLLLFTGAVLFTPNTDTQLRTALVTALTTSVAAAISFYFATKSNAAAIAALTPNAPDPVPDLVGLTADEALRLLGLTGFKLASIEGQTLLDASTTIAQQDRKSDTRAPGLHHHRDVRQRGGQGRRRRRQSGRRQIGLGPSAVKSRHRECCAGWRAPVGSRS